MERLMMRPCGRRISLPWQGQSNTGRRRPRVDAVWAAPPSTARCEIERTLITRYGKMKALVLNF
jgi:hypothetical protein